jgi:hypothetical protein
MASQLSANRHSAARNTILLWLSAAIALACVMIVVTYHALRDDPVGAVASEPLMSKRNATISERDRALLARRMTDSTADVARAHDSAVSAATKAATAPAEAN